MVGLARTMRKCARINTRHGFMTADTDSPDSPSSDPWRWPFLAAIVVLLVCSGLAILQYARYGDAATRELRDTESSMLVQQQTPETLAKALDVIDRNSRRQSQILVEMHGGSVDAISEGEGMGSLFTVRLPLALTNGAVEKASAQPDMPLTTFANLLENLQVLVLDDEDDAREVVQRLLEDAGARVRTAGNAAEAMKILESRFRPDIIVSDIGMPEEDGYEFMQRVRRMGGRIAEVPAAALTALARLEDRKRALMAGYQAHLAKPVYPAELVAMVASLAGRTGRTVA
jgi:CheY-like chemotaxis protein